LKPCVNLLAVKDPSKLTWQFGGLFLFNLAANFFVIPLWGVLGAASVLVACEGISLLAALALTRSYFNSPGPDFFRGLIAGVLSAVVLGAGLQYQPGLFWLALGPLVYGGCLWLFKALDRDDWASLRSVLPKKGMGVGRAG
jgi:O-antigen/teichoic acid export membrane protein